MLAVVAAFGFFLAAILAWIVNHDHVPALAYAAACVFALHFVFGLYVSRYRH